MVPHSQAMPHALPEQHAASRRYASYGFEGTWPGQHMPGAVKPMETISLKDGSLADIAVVGQILFPSLISCSCGCLQHQAAIRAHLCGPDHTPLTWLLRFYNSVLSGTLKVH